MQTMDRWTLPVSAEFGGQVLAIHADFREGLDLLELLQDNTEPQGMRVQIALRLFYDSFETLPPDQWQNAVQWMFTFLNGGEEEPAGPSAPKLLDWQQDQPLIVADINRVAGCEVRGLPFLHWWTFLGYFQAIGEGLLSTVVGIRDKRRRGKKLDQWEQEFYRDHKAQVDLRPHYTSEELAQREWLERMLGG